MVCAACCAVLTRTTCTQYGANPRALNRYGLTPFELVCSANMTEALAALEDSQPLHGSESAPPRPVQELQQVVLLVTGLDALQKVRVQWLPPPTTGSHGRLGRCTGAL